MPSFLEKLKRQADGELLSDTFSKKIYSVDASIYEVEPLGIFYPRNLMDVQLAAELAKDFEVPLIPRGAATGTAGGCLGRGLVLDFSKHMNRILAIDPERREAVVEPGVVQNHLNRNIRPYGLRLGPNTSTGNRATIGGMIAANSAGAHSLRYGMMADALLEVEMVCQEGETLRFHPLSKQQYRNKLHLRGLEGKIYRMARKFAKNHKKAILSAYPNIPRKVSGYNLLPLLEDTPNLSPFIAGSEGTLGLLTQAKVALAPFPKFVGICVLSFSGLKEAFETVSKILDQNPYSFEMIDERIIEAGKQSPMMRGELNWLSDQAKILFFIEWDSDTKEELEKKLAAFVKTAEKNRWGTAPFSVSGRKQMAQIWKLREAGLGLLMSRRSYEKAIAFIEDIALPPRHLKDFLPPFLEVLKSHHKEAGFYGHVGAGCLHIRPYIDLRKEEELKTMQAIMEETTELVKTHGGVLSGEHGDGLIRSWLNPKLFAPEIYTLFQEVKKTFDTRDIFNPGKVVNGPPLADNLRISPQTKFNRFETFLSFEKEGGFELSVEMCNGNGECRKDEGLMCPTFQATKDEHFSTRGRAQSLRAIVGGRLPKAAFTSPELYEILDWCIECKGCKTQCPSQVDMAKIKSEFLYHYQKEHGFSLRSKLFAHVNTLSYFASFTPTLANSLAPLILPRLGISKERSLPPFAPKTFSSLFKKYRQPSNLEKKVYLLVDTFTEYNSPEIGVDALKILNALGFEVVIQKQTCCGRPMLSKGFLPQAKKQAEKVYKKLKASHEQAIPVIGLEPSCFFTVKDDYTDLLPGADPKVFQNIWYFDTFIKHLPYKLKLRLPTSPPLIHRHCYHKSVETSLNDASPIPEGIILPTGCCGMAGSFGYEAEHTDFSRKIAQTTLLPYLPRDEKKIVIANGFSCRSQIKELDGSSPLHLAQYLAEWMEPLP